ncbi:MAG: hypothetical protein WA960_02270 [Tunicatimonas sp.]
MKFTLFLSVVLSSISNTVLCQNIDTVHADSINIEGISYRSPLDSVEKKLGSPLSYTVYEEEEGEAEGHDKWFYFTYDSLHLAFHEWNQEVYLSSFTTSNRSYVVKLGLVSTILGASVTTLQAHFPNSFKDFVSRQKQKGSKDGNLYIKIALVYSNAVSYDGIVNLRIVDNKISEVSASFQPA